MIEVSFKCYPILNIEWHTVNRNNNFDNYLNPFIYKVEYVFILKYEVIKYTFNLIYIILLFRIYTRETSKCHDNISRVCLRKGSTYWYIVGD